MRFTSYCLLAGLIATTVFAGEPHPKPQPAEIRALIDRLASQNPKAITAAEDPNVEPEYKLPPGYDRAKQGIVHISRFELVKLGPIAFPHLIERWDDSRYCMTQSEGLNGYCYNRSVGDICHAIVFDQLQPYGTWPKVEDDPRGKPRRPSFPETMLGSKEVALKWYDLHKDKSLLQLQLLVADWVIAEEARRPNDFTKAEAAEMKKIREELVKDGKYNGRGNFYGMDTEL